MVQRELSRLFGSSANTDTLVKQRGDLNQIYIFLRIIIYNEGCRNFSNFPMPKSVEQFAVVESLVVVELVVKLVVKLVYIPLSFLA